jgi:glutamyl-tRNA synthetase
VPGAEERLIEDLQWAGLEWDEGPGVDGPHGPYRQSERNGIYRQHAQQLLDSGKAYRCFCTAKQAHHAYVVSGCHQDCASLSKDESDEKAHSHEQPFTVRLTMPEDMHKRKYPDLVYGNIKPLKRSPTALASEDEEGDIAGIGADVILMKSDGTPTYHFANVVDDHLMQISHVIRGSEWTASLPLHYQLYSALGWEPPLFAHVGLLIDENRAKLSKRSDTGVAMDVRSMRQDLGVLPEALCAFVSLLGWTNPAGHDLHDLNELIRIFDLKFTKGNAMVNMEKLWFMQKKFAARRVATVREHPEKTVELIDPIVGRMQTEILGKFPGLLDTSGADGSRLDEAWLRQRCEDVLVADCINYRTPKEFVERNKYFFHFEPDLVPPPSERVKGMKIIPEETLQSLVLWFQPAMFERRAPRETERAEDGKTTLSGILDFRVKPAYGGGRWFQPLWFEDISRRIHGDIDSCAMELAFDEYVRTRGGRPIPLNEVTVEDIEAIKKGQKEYGKALMKALRERLSYGMPGPSIGVVVAILGREECCRRLGIEDQAAAEKGPSEAREESL